MITVVYNVIVNSRLLTHNEVHCGEGFLNKVYLQEEVWITCNITVIHETCKEHQLTSNFFSFLLFVSTAVLKLKEIIDYKNVFT